MTNIERKKQVLRELLLWQNKNTPMEDKIIYTLDKLSKLDKVFKKRNRNT